MVGFSHGPRRKSLRAVHTHPVLGQYHMNTHTQKDSNGASLTQKKCVACEGLVDPLNRVEAEVLLRQTPQWMLSDDAGRISREFSFKNFLEAVTFVNKITALAEEEGHHPDLEVGWGRVLVKLTTHAIKGLSENDFILAAKIDAIAR